MKDYTEKILEEFEKDIKPMIENEVLYRYDNLELAQDSADTLNKGIRQFLSTSITQAIAEDRERVMELIKENKWTHHTMGDDTRKEIPVEEVNELCLKSNNIFADDLLSSLDKLTDE